MKKGQISVEHLFILMLAVTILVPGTFLFYQFAKSSSNQMVASQVKRIGDEVLKNSETVYFLGDGSRLILSLNFPRTVKDISLDQGELTIKYQTYSGVSEAVFFPENNLEGFYAGKIMEQFHTGPVRISISNDQGDIMLQEVVS